MNFITFHVYVYKSQYNVKKMFTVRKKADRGTECSQEGTDQTKVVLHSENTRLLIHILQSSSRNLLTSRYKWLIWSEIRVLDETPAIYNIESDVTWATPEDYVGRITLHGVYKTGRLIATPLGYWDQVHGMVLYLKEQNYMQRRNLEGVNFRAGIVVSICEIYKNILHKFRKINQNHSPFRQTHPDVKGQKCEACRSSQHIFLCLLNCVELISRLCDRAS